MWRVAVVIDTPAAIGRLGSLLDAIAQSHDAVFSALVLPAPGARGAMPSPTLLGAATRALVRLESGGLALAARGSGSLARRMLVATGTSADVRKRFGQVVTLAPDAPALLDEAPDLVLVLGGWLPAALLARCPSTTIVLQVELGSHPEHGLDLVGLEECLTRADVTPVRIHRVRPEDGERTLLLDGRNRTRRLLSLNQAALWDRALSLLRACLPEIGRDDAASPAGRSPEAPDRLNASPPSWGQLVAYPVALIVQAGRLALSLVRRERGWSVAIYRSGDAGEPFGERAEVDPAPPGTYQADPVLYRDPDTGVACCFVEEVDLSNDRGHIAVLRESGGVWRRAGIALREPFHLSFPFLFRFDGELYMCPEAGASREIRIYRCISFPLEWELVTSVMSDVSATDTILFPKDGRWWMLTNIDRGDYPDHQSELHLFHAATPLADDWKAVSWNPVFIDCRGARNGGFEIIGERIYRYGQVQSFEAYGSGINRYEVAHIGLDGYREVLRERIEPPAESCSKGMHSFGRIDGWTAVDLLGGCPGAPR